MRAMEAVGLTDQDVEELRLAMEEAEEGFALEENYVKDILPLPKLRAIAPMWTIYLLESPLSSSECLLPALRALSSRAGASVERTLGSPATEEPALGFLAHPTLVAQILEVNTPGLATTTPMPRQAEQLRPGRSLYSFQEHLVPLVTKIVRCSTIN